MIRLAEPHDMPEPSSPNLQRRDTENGQRRVTPRADTVEPTHGEPQEGRRGGPCARLYTMNPYYQDDYVTIYHGDCRDILPSLPEAELLLTDPPYGIGRRAFRDDLGAAISGMNLTLAKKAIAFCSPRLVMCFLQGCNTWRFLRMLWWNKTADLSFPWRGWYMNSEAICVLERDGAQWDQDCRYHSDLYQTGPEGKKPLHPCWKPVDLLMSLIQHGSLSGVIIDPFCGSGPTLRAAKDLKRKAIGIEIEEKYCEIAAKRMRQEVLL